MLQEIAAQDKKVSIYYLTMIYLYGPLQPI